MADLATVYRRPFAEQVAALRLRLGNQVATGAWDDLWKSQHDRAFVVAGAMKADLLADLGKAVEKSIVEGKSLQEFRKDFREIVQRRGWHGWTGEDTEQGQAWRTKVIYQTNMRTSYMAGRHAQLVKAGYKYWIYRHGGSADPRVEHLGWDGLVLPADHPFWLTHFPPNGWGCSCYVIGARSLTAARRLGGNPDLVLPEGWAALKPATGEPHGIGKGWGYAPGRSVVDAINELVAGKVAKLPQKIAEDLAQDVATIPAAPAYREARSLKDAADLVVEEGLAKQRVSWPSGAPLSGINEAINALREVEQRFDMTALEAIGSGPAIAKLMRVRGAPRKACAWYSHQIRSMGWNKGGLSSEPWGQTKERRDLMLKEWKRSQSVELSRLPEGPAKTAAERVNFQWTVRMGGNGYPRSVAIHETGHRLHYSYWDEVNETLVGWKSDGWHLAVSKYGSSNPKEFVAESFVLYMEGPEQHWRIKPELLAFFKAKDKRNAVG